MSRAEELRLEQMPLVEVWTDGSTRPTNPGPGGWAAILRFIDKRGDTHERELVGGHPETTNNRMELQAVIEALTEISKPCKVHVFTDSTYVKNGIERWMKVWKKNGWLTREKEPVKNRDLWSALETATLVHDVCWFWLRGHNGNAMNERVDVLAGQVALKAAELTGAWDTTMTPEDVNAIGTTARRVREKNEAIRMAPHLALDKEFDERVARDD